MNAQEKYDIWLKNKDHFQKMGIGLVDYWQTTLDDAEQIGRLKGMDDGYKQCQHDDEVFGTESYHGDITLLWNFKHF